MGGYPKGRKAPRRVILAMHSGTYGRTDDVVGGLIIADTLLTKGDEVTIILRGDGVYAAVAGQNPRSIGLESHVDVLEAAVEMGAKVLVIAEDMNARGLKPKDLLDYIQVITENKLQSLMADNDHWIPI